MYYGSSSSHNLHRRLKIGKNGFTLLELMVVMAIMALIIAGYGFKRTGFLPEEAWSGMEKLTYFVLFPSLDQQQQIACMSI